MFDTIKASADGRLGTLTLARPEALNALSTHTLREIADAARWFDAQPDVRVVVVSGQGRAFSAGADVKAFVPDGDTPTDVRAAADAGRLAADALEQMAAVTIARIHGWCVGGGVVMAAACDLRVAAEGTRFSIPEVDLGIPLAWGGIPRLVREIGAAATKELVMTCREFGAEEAHRLGFLNRIVPEAELDQAVDELADTIVAKPWLAITSTKRHVNAVTDGMVQMGRTWADADGLLAGLRDPEGRAAAAAYLDRVRRR